MKPSEVPQEAVTAFCQAFWGASTVETRPAMVELARATLAAVLPAHERQVRERVAAEIRADHNLGRVVAPYERCVRVALDRDPDGWPTDEREVDALLDRIARGES